MNHIGKTTLTKCEEIQTVLFDYLARELGAAQSDVVREHLRRCERCRQTAAELRHTLELLHAVDVAAPRVPARLSEERHKRLRWAALHPVLDWIYGHHALVSIMVALLALGVTVALLRGRTLWRSVRNEGVTVTVGHEETAPGHLDKAANATVPVEETALQMLRNERTNAAPAED